MDEEINKWFTEHGKVVKAEPVEDKNAVVPGSTLIRYEFEDGAVLTLRAAKHENGEQIAPQEIVGRELPKPKDEKATSGPKEEDTRGPQTGPKREVYRGGKWVTEDNPTYVAPAADSRPQIVATNTTEPYIVTSVDGKLVSSPNPNYKEPPPKPGTTITARDGKGRTFLIPVDANGNPGTPRDSGLEGEPPKAGTIVKGGGPNGEDVQAIAGPDGRLTYEPIPGAVGEKPAPESVSGYTPDTGGDFGMGTKGDYGIADYNSQVRAEVAAGRLSEDKGRKLVEGALALANAAEARRQTRVSEASTTRSQDISQRNTDVQAGTSRYSSAGSTFGNVLNQITPVGLGMGPGNGQTAAAMLEAVLAMGANYQQAAGGAIPGQVGLSSPLAPYASPGGPGAAQQPVTITIGGPAASAQPQPSSVLGPLPPPIFGPQPMVDQAPQPQQLPSPIFGPQPMVDLAAPQANAGGPSSLLANSVARPTRNPSRVAARLAAMGFSPEASASVFG